MLLIACSLLSVVLISLSTPAPVSKAGATIHLPLSITKLWVYPIRTINEIHSGSSDNRLKVAESFTKSLEGNFQLIFCHDGVTIKKTEPALLTCFAEKLLAALNENSLVLVKK